MQIPDGRDCPYYYVNAHRRARAEERCHLLVATADAAHWTSTLCRTCAVPDIRRANGCPHMTLIASVSHAWPRFLNKPRIRVRATCARSATVVENPFVGCGQCHRPVVFVVEDTQDNNR